MNNADRVLELLKEALDRAIAEGILDKDGLQRLIENGDELQSDVMASIRRVSLSDQFADEEVESSYGYLSGYRTPKPIDEQVKLLNGFFPNLGNVNEKLVEQPLPQDAEGYFAIPRWQKIAPTYGEALQKVLDLIKQTRDGKFYNYREGQLGSDRLRQHAKTAKVEVKLGQEQEGYDIFVVPCQFGIKHRGRSVRRAREVFNASEFGLGAFAVACMVLTHPERLRHYDDLWIDCAGDEYDPRRNGSFDQAPVLYFNDDKIKFFDLRVVSTIGFYGAASGFLPT
jgi:hypothetical protein